MTETVHYTREDITNALRNARESVEEADVPDDLRESAFERAFDAYLGLGSGSAPAGGGPATTVAKGGSDEPFAAIAQRFGLDEATVTDVYHLDDGGLALGIAPSRFEKMKAAGTKQIALLIAAGRQAAGLEEWTPVVAIREVTRDYGRFDSSNFAATVKDMGFAFNYRGRGRDVEVRVTRPGFEQASALIRELVSE